MGDDLRNDLWLGNRDVAGLLGRRTSNFDGSAIQKRGVLCHRLSIDFSRNHAGVAQQKAGGISTANGCTVALVDNEWFVRIGRVDIAAKAFGDQHCHLQPGPQRDSFER